jgi:hypothetical protein
MHSSSLVPPFDPHRSLVIYCRVTADVRLGSGVLFAALAIMALSGVLFAALAIMALSSAEG